MGDLREYVSDSAELRSYLLAKAAGHRHFKAYMKMPYAAGVMNDHVMYLTAGDNWNDTRDREQMKNPCAFSTCFSYAESENVAMWMLYGGEGGKTGGMVDYPKKVIRDLLNAKSLRLGRLNSKGFICDAELTAESFRMELIDVLYVDHPYEEKKTYRINRADEFASITCETLTESDIILKSYPWHYERECRMTLRIYGCDDLIAQKGCNAVQLTIPKADRKLLRLYASPVYQGEKPEGAADSALKGEVDWELFPKKKQTKA